MDVNTDSLLATSYYASHTTDSAAAATALATGTVTLNGYVGKDKDGKDLTTVLDYAAIAGKATGILSNDRLYGATPAGFSAHATDRNDKQTILDSQLTSGVNLLCAASSGTCSEKKEAAIASGYAFCDTFAQRENVMTSEKAYCLFPLEGSYSDVSLADAAEFALEYLSQDEDGFVLMIEQAFIDKNAHGNNFDKTVGAVNSLNRTVERVTEWMNGRTDTAVLVTADHETGALSVSKENNLPNVYHTPQGDIYYKWEKTEHSDADVPLFAYNVPLYELASEGYYSSEHIVKNADIPMMIRKMIALN